MPSSDAPDTFPSLTAAAAKAQFAPLAIPVAAADPNRLLCEAIRVLLLHSFAAACRLSIYGACNIDEARQLALISERATKLHDEIRRDVDVACFIDLGEAARQISKKLREQSTSTPAVLRHDDTGELCSADDSIPFEHATLGQRCQNRRPCPKHGGRR